MSIFRFFLPYLQDHDLLRSKNFVSMTMWRDDFSSLHLKRNERSVNRLGEDSLFSSPRPRAIIPDARPLGTFENQDTRDSI